MKNTHKTCCFTGHRPEKLGGYNIYNQKNIAIANAIKKGIINLIDNFGVKRFICGGALGVDTVSCLVLEKLKKEKYPDIYIVLAMPFKNQDAKWFNQEDKDRLQHQKELVDEVVLVDELTNTKYYCDLNGLGNYHPAKMQKRNEYMVDNSDFVIAVFDGEQKGGTFNCIKYALKQTNRDLQIHIINPNTLEVEIKNTNQI